MHFSGSVHAFLQEKFNVWLALLNMEHKYGSMETLETAFARAVAESKVRAPYSYLNFEH